MGAQGLDEVNKLLPAKRGSQQWDNSGGADNSELTDFLGDKGLEDLHRLISSSLLFCNLINMGPEHLRYLAKPAAPCHP